MDELHPDFLPAVAHIWTRAAVYTPDAYGLDRPYAWLSTPRLQEGLRTRCAGAEWIRGRATAVTHTDTGSTVRLHSGRLLRARVVVDATGGHSGLLECRTEPAAWQTAYGVTITVPGGHPWPLDEICLMDFRGTDALPTFLYAQPLDAERVFVEETVLIRRPAVPTAALQQRLFARLAAMGVRGEPGDDVEHCRIRMLGTRPVFGQRVVGFGSSAGMVHPATGYQLARLPAGAEAIADALVAGLQQSPGDAAEGAWAALWPIERQRQWALYRFGANILCDLNADDTRRFFDAFFQIDASLWSGFLSATLPPLGLARAMAAVFSAASLPIRRQLISAGASGQGLDLIRSISRPTP